MFSNTICDLKVTPGAHYWKPIWPIQKLNVYKIVLQEVCKKFNGTKEYIKKRIEELCNEKKLSAEEVTYLFTNNFKFC